jgi:GNAT superfamily N-acetyltransferase
MFDAGVHFLAPGTMRSYNLRLHRPGDMGWVVHRHGVLYFAEYGVGERFEAGVARLVAEFIEHHDRDRERCWIAERDSVNVGSVFCVKVSEDIADLRLLLVEPSVRGQGVGARLVDECIAFARERAYRALRLSTNDVFRAARHIYERRLFRLVEERPYDMWGRTVMGQNWELDLRQ